MTQNSKIHAIKKSAPVLVVLMGMAGSILDKAWAEPEARTGINNTSVAPIIVTANYETSLLAPSNVNIAVSDTVDRPDLQFVDPTRFGPDTSIQKTSGGSVQDIDTKRYSTNEIADLIETESFKVGLDPALTRIVIEIESQFDQFATSETGAMGLMQLMPDTAKELGVVNAYDAAQNIRGGVSYLKQLLDEFHNPLMAVAAYHSGPQAARDANGIPQGPRTGNYVVRILNDYYRIGEGNLTSLPLATPYTNPASKIYSTSTGTTGINSQNRTANQRRNDDRLTVKVSTLQENGDPQWEAGFVMNLD